MDVFEYAIQASSSYLKKDIDHLERLQRQAAPMVIAIGVYLEKPEKLSLLFLARRPLRGDLILACNRPNSSFDLPIEEFSIQPPCSSLRGYILK